MPDGGLTLGTVRPGGTGSIDVFIGLLAGQTTKVAMLEEIEEATQAGWAEEVS